MIFIYSKLEDIFSCTDRDLDQPSQSRNQVIPRRVISPLNLGWDQKKNREEYLSLKGSVHFFFFKQILILIVSLFRETCLPRSMLTKFPSLFLRMSVPRKIQHD